MHDEIKRFKSQAGHVMKYEVLIGGITIANAFDHPEMHADLGALLLGASAVIVYRSSPGQKADVVNFMKKFIGRKVTLAIGDGANDVNMI